MAIYRPILIEIWNDPDFEKYKPNTKLIFLYLCTNSCTRESGVYPISEKKISNETNLNIKTVTELLGNCLKNVTYDFINKYVFVHKFLQYNGGGKPELLRNSIAKDFFKSGYLETWNLFITEYDGREKFQHIVDKIKTLINSSKTVDKLLVNGCSEIFSNTSNDSIPINSNNSIEGLETVKKELTPKEKYQYAMGMKKEKEWDGLKEIKPITEDNTSFAIFKDIVNKILPESIIKNRKGPK